MEIAVLALGCFWGPEIKFSKIPGIIKTEVGYCGGSKPKVTYKEVCTGETNHAEVVNLILMKIKYRMRKLLINFLNSRSYNFKFSRTRFWNTV